MLTADAVLIPPSKPIVPTRELGAYECLWAEPGASFKRIADKFRERPDALPSDLVDETAAMAMARCVLEELGRSHIESFGVRVHRAGEYPAKLRDARHPVELLFYRGWWNWVESPSVAIVGSRIATKDGLDRTRKLTSSLVQDGYTIVSGLARGVDTAAHEAAFEFGGSTIAVIGTPIHEVYPKENAELQEQIAKQFLVISQVPVHRYSQQDWRKNRNFFPERNITMSALTEATIIVEASETSGTLGQARAALHQRRKLFILNNCFENPEITWPARFEEKGAIRVRDYADIKSALS